MNRLPLKVLVFVLGAGLLAHACGRGSDDTDPGSRATAAPAVSPAESSPSPDGTPDPHETSPAYDASLSVHPERGPVGTKVTLEGRNCKNDQQTTTTLVFEGHGEEGGTEGSDQLIPGVPTDDEGRFKTSYQIPAEFGSLQGLGGGTVKPGKYYFISRPVVCSVGFIVTEG